MYVYEYEFLLLLYLGVRFWDSEFNSYLEYHCLNTPQFYLYRILTSLFLIAFFHILNVIPFPYLDIIKNMFALKVLTVKEAKLAPS